MTATTHSTNANWLIFRIGRVACAVPALTVESILPLPEHITALPGADAGNPGVFHHNSGTVAIIDLRHRFGCDQPDPRHGRLLLGRVGTGRYGFWVDSIVGLAEASQVKPAPLPPELPHNVFSAALRYQDEIVLCSDLTRLLTMREAGGLRHLVCAASPAAAETAPPAPAPPIQPPTPSPAAAPVAAPQPVPAPATAHPAPTPRPAVAATPRPAVTPPPRPVSATRPPRPPVRPTGTIPAVVARPAVTPSPAVEARPYQSPPPLAAATSQPRAAPPWPLLLLVLLLAAAGGYYLFPAPTPAPSPPAAVAWLAPEPAPLPPPPAAEPSPSPPASPIFQGEGIQVEQHGEEITIVIERARQEPTATPAPATLAQAGAGETTAVVAESTVPPPAEPEPPQMYVHTVVKGDTLWAIAEHYLDDPWRYKELAQLSRIRNPDLIYPGNKVRVIIR